MDVETTACFTLARGGCLNIARGGCWTLALGGLFEGLGGLEDEALCRAPAPSWRKPRGKQQYHVV